MTYNPDVHHRRSIRLWKFDYSSSGAYFVTVCVLGRECLFGGISECRGEPRVRPNFRGDDGQGDHMVRPYGTAGFSLGRVCQAFKSLTTVEYVRGVKDHDWSPFPGRLWQRNYHERVIRDERELIGIREYIRNNPMKWEHDEENPANAPP
jgi:hypothetical protein